MKLAIMQPYFFPYLGYYQLVNAVDKFVFYDDVNFINKGWVNRNNIVVNGKKHLFTAPLKEFSSLDKISDISLQPEMFPKWKKKWRMTVQQAYSKAPYYKKTYQLIDEILENKKTISELAKSSVISVSDYLGLKTEFIYSSEFYNNRELKGQERIVSICEKEKAVSYFNPTGGVELYDKVRFRDKGIDLFFLESKLPPYKQFDNEFVPGLSIIDVLMFNSKEEIKTLLDEYILN